ncbi:uncharacterized protein TNCV_3223531 [Trichonephila clavipes]|nr:uncharacterized protein TNCV_3223531 [Trichonephila clavipes]
MFLLPQHFVKFQKQNIVLLLQRFFKKANLSRLERDPQEKEPLEDLFVVVDPTENSLAVLNHKILEANSQVQNMKLGGHQTCLSINRLWHELCDMLRHLVGTTAPGHHDCSIQE